MRLEAALDGPDSKGVGNAIRSLVRGSKELRIACAYVTADPVEFLQIPKSIRSPLLICDPFSGACNPNVLLNLKKHGWEVRCLPSLHAKVFLTTHGAFVGSANLSSIAIGKAGAAGNRGTIEAGLVSRDTRTRDTLGRWMSGLRDRSESLSDISRNPARWAQIVAAWESRQRRAKSKVSLLDALKQPDLALWDKYVFAFACDSDIDVTLAKNTAKKNNLLLPKGWTHDETELYDFSPREIEPFLKRVAGMGAGRIVITLWAETKTKEYPRRKREVVSRVIASEPSFDRFEAAVRSENVLFCYSTSCGKSEIDFSSTDIRKIASRLNASINSGNHLLDAFQFVKPEKVSRMLIDQG